MYPHSSLSGRSEVNHRGHSRPLSAQRKHQSTSVTNLAEMNPYPPFISPSVCLPVICCPQKLKVVLSCHFSTKLLFFAKIFYNLTRFSQVCDVLVKSLCLFSLVNLSFVSLICRVPANESRWVEEKQKFLSLLKSESVFPSGNQIIIIKLGWGQGWYNQRIYSQVSKVTIVFCF